MRTAAVFAFIILAGLAIHISRSERPYVKPRIVAQDRDGKTILIAVCKDGYRVELGSLNQERPARVINNYLYARCEKGEGPSQVSQELR